MSKGHLVFFSINGIFIVSWVVSTIIYKVKKYDDIKVNIAAPHPGTGRHYGQ